MKYLIVFKIKKRYEKFPLRKPTALADFCQVDFPSIHKIMISIQCIAPVADPVTGHGGRLVAKWHIVNLLVLFKK